MTHIVHIFQRITKQRCFRLNSPVRLCLVPVPIPRRTKRLPYRIIVLPLVVALLLQMLPVSLVVSVPPSAPPSVVAGSQAVENVLPTWFKTIPGQADIQGANLFEFGPRLAYAQGISETLELSKSAPSEVDQGELIRYILQITNTSVLTTAEKVVVTDTIPSLGTYTIYNPPDDGEAGVIASSDGDWYASHPGGSDYIRWGTLDGIPGPFLHGLPPGGTAELYFDVRVIEPVPDQTVISNSDYAAYAKNAAVVTGGTIQTRVNAPHWAISKDVSSGTIEPGDYLTYTIRASNDGHLAAMGRYTITDVIPQYTDYIQSTPLAVKTDNLLTWAFSETLAIGASRVVTYVVQVTETEPLTDGLEIINATYSVTGSNVYTGASGPPVASTVKAPVLHITKSDYRDPVDAGGILTYTLAYSNSGGATATDVTITDTIDGYTEFVTSSPPPTKTVGSTHYWDIGELSNGSPDGPIIITVTVTSPLTDGLVLTNLAGIASPQGYGYADQTAETTTVEGETILHLAKEASTDVAEPGDLITYTLSYSNSGNAPATGVQITDTIDANTTFVTSDPPPDSGSYVWDIGTLLPSDTHQIIVTVQVTDSLPNGTILTNDALIRDATDVTDTGQATVTVESAPILHLAKEASSDIIEPGDTLTYTIWYSNTGNAPATGIVITDSLPTQLHLKSADPPISSGGDQQQTWDVGVVNVGGPYAVTLVVTSDDVITDLTTLTNQVTMSSVETTTLLAGESVTVHAGELDVEKTASTGLVKANEFITYTISVMNSGHAVADQVRITDTLPTDLQSGSIISSTSPGVVLDSATPPVYVWATPVLTGLSQLDITISGRLNTSPWSASGDVFSNTVQVGSNNSEVNLANNYDLVPATGRPGDPYTVTLTAVPTETTVGNSVLVTTTITDQWGNPAYNNEIVAFDSTLGTILPVFTTTLNGVATGIAYSSLPGVATISSTVGGIDATTLVTFTTGAPHHFVFTPTIPSPQTAGVPFSATIQAMDEYGNVVPTYTTSANLGDVTGTMLPTSTGTGWSGGVWSGTIIITGAMRNNVITATDGVISGTSNLFDVRPGPPDSATLAVTSPMSPCGATSVHTATVRDSFGNTLWAGVDTTFDLAEFGTGANLVPSSPYVGQTNDAGMVTATVQSANNTGLVRLEVDVDSDGSDEAFGFISIRGIGIATDMQIDANPPAVVAGNTSIVTVTLLDCAGQSVSGASVDLTENGMGNLVPTTGSTNASGVFTSTFTAGVTPGTAIVTATSDSLVRATSIDITGGPVFTITKTANPASGTTIPVTETIPYTIVVTNAGTDATGFVLTDPIPANSQLVPGSVSASPWANITSTDPIEVKAGSFSGSGQVLTVTFSVKPTGSGNISNQVSIKSDQTEQQSSNGVSHSAIAGGGPSTVFLPIIFKNWNGAEPPSPTDANLRITDIGFVGGDAPNEGTPYHVYVEVSNVGTETVTSNFWVDLYLNPISTPALNQPWQTLSQSGTQGVSNCTSDSTCYGRAWFVTTNLAPGDDVTLTTQLPIDQRYDRWPINGVSYVSSRHNPILALVDSWGNPSYGIIFENSETDNLSGTISGAGVIGNRTVLEPPIAPTWSAGSRRPALPVPRE